MPFKDSEQQKAYMKNWHKNHKKEDEAYYLKNKEHIATRSKDYNEKHKEKKKVYDKEYAKEYMPEYLRTANAKRRIEIIQLLGSKCANPYNLPHPDWCNSPECLQVDHINGGGYKERHRFKSPYSLYKYILEQIKEGSPFYQLLCANCNWIKRSKNPNEHR
jgi:hypothetical protein